MLGRRRRLHEGSHDERQDQIDDNCSRRRRFVRSSGAAADTLYMVAFFRTDMLMSTTTASRPRKPE